jgi:hypothetical protein
MADGRVLRVRSVGADPGDSVAVAFLGDMILCSHKTRVKRVDEDKRQVKDDGCSFRFLC